VNGPPEKERTGPLTKDRPPAKSIATADDKQILRPWGDDPEVERRFQLDRQCWRRRILHARRTSYDANDPIAPYHGRWTA
jgi:hypothetical protein